MYHVFLLFMFFLLSQLLMFFLHMSVRFVVWIFSLIGRIFRHVVPVGIAAGKSAVDQISNWNNRSPK